MVAEADLRGILKPLDVVRDPMHVTLANGIMNIECCAAIIAIENESRWEVFAMLEHLAKADWNKHSRFSYVFNEEHAKSRKRPSCSSAVHLSF